MLIIFANKPMMFLVTYFDVASAALHAADERLQSIIDLNKRISIRNGQWSGHIMSLIHTDHSGMVKLT